MVLSHYGIEKSEDELAVLTKASRQDGTEPNGIVSGAKDLGFAGSYFKSNSSIKEIKDFVSRDIPVIVLWFSPEEGGHWSVVVGFEDEIIIMADPLLGEFRKMKIPDFLNRWFELDDYPPQSPGDFILRGMVVIAK